MQTHSSPFFTQVQHRYEVSQVLFRYLLSQVGCRYRDSSFLSGVLQVPSSSGGVCIQRFFFSQVGCRPIVSPFFTQVQHRYKVSQVGCWYLCPQMFYRYLPQVGCRSEDSSSSVGCRYLLPQVGCRYLLSQVGCRYYLYLRWGAGTTSYLRWGTDP